MRGQTITSYNEPSPVSAENPIDLNQRSAILALSVSSSNKKTSEILDPRYVKLAVTLRIKNGQESLNRNIAYHQCSEDDYTKFYEISSSDKQSFEFIKDDPERGFLCLDWDDSDPIELLGFGWADEYSKILEINLLPCN